jgi:hypothetical protein
MKNQMKRAVSILTAGGSVYMHENDAQNIKDSTLPEKYSGFFGEVNIVTDYSGMVREGDPVIALIGGDMVLMNSCASEIK